MKYGITDLAGILGITTSAVRYFEKENIISVGKEDSGNRVYDEEDVFRLLSYMKYRSMKIPVKEIRVQWSGKENQWEQILERETAARDEAIRQEMHYHWLAENIDRQIGKIQKITSLLDKYEFEKSPSVLCMQAPGDGWISKDRAVQETVSKWVRAMPEVFLGILHTENHTAGFGFFIHSDSSLQNNIPALKATALPSASCIHTIVKAQPDFAYHPQKVFEPVCRYAKTRGFTIQEGGWGQILLVEVGEKQILHPFLEVWLPVS